MAQLIATNQLTLTNVIDGKNGVGLLTTWSFYKLSNSTSTPQVVPIGSSTNLSHLGPNNTWTPYKELSGGSAGWGVIDFDKIAKSDIIPDKPFTWYLEASFDGVSNFNGSTDFNIKFENLYVNSAGSTVYNSLGTRDFQANKFSATNDTAITNYFSQSVTWTVPRAVYDAIPDGGFLNLRIRIDRFTKLFYHAKNSYVTYGTVPSDPAQRGLGNYSTYGWKASPEVATQALPYLWIYQIQLYDDGKEVAIPPTLIGTQGADGRTPYVHWAYSDNADGTGFTTSDNGQRYIGNYSDYTQADSTDKTKYRWADRWAKIEVNGRNLAQKTSSEWSNPYTSFSGTANTCPPLYKVLIDDLKVGDTLKSRIVLKYTDIVSASGKTSTILLQGDGNITGWNAGSYNSTQAKPISGSGEMVFEHEFKIKADHLKNAYLNWAFRTDYIASGSLQWRLAKVEKGTVFTGWSPAPEDVENKLDTKANKAELDKVVYKTDISVTDEGIVHSASKTVNGQTIASMIAQRAEWVEIIAKLLKVKGDMIVNGTIGADKLSVDTLSALTADLGEISGGSLKLLESVAKATSVDAWGNFTIPAHKWGIYIDNIGIISSGTPVRKSSSESVASDMPVAVLSSGQLLFAMVDQNNDLGNLLHYGLSDPDNATISFTVASDGTKQLLIQANGQIVNRGTNYTGWNSTGVAGVFYKRQGDVVALKMQVNTTANQSYNLGRIPVALLPIQNAGTMMRVTAWTADQSFGRNLQINGDGSMVLLASNRGDTFNTQVTWII